MFLLLKGDFEERLDAEFYKYDYIEMMKKISSSPHNVIRLDKVINSIINGYDFRDYKDKGTPYIKVANVKKGEFDFTKIQFIDLNSDTINKAIQLKKGNLLLTRKGTYGNALSLDSNYDFVISSEVFYIDLNQEKVESKYLEIFFNSNIGQQQFKRVSIGAIMGSLSQESVKILKIPSPPLKIQQTIINIFEKAYATKKVKEAQAKALLASIDDYLLKELEIILPDKQENSLKNRVFLRNISQVSGGRFDPNKYDSDMLARFQAIEKSPFSKTKLKEILTQSCAGDWGIDESEKIEADLYEKCLVIRATEFDNNFNLKVDNSRVKYRLLSKAKLQKLDIMPNDLLIEKSGGSENQPVGRIAIIEHQHTENQSIAYSNFIHKIRVDESIVNPVYLFHFLKTIHNIKITESMQSQTNGIRNLIMSEYFNQTIILPEIQTQIDIAQKITSLKNQAQTLQTEAKEILGKAKAEVERMILG